MPEFSKPGKFEGVPFMFANVGHLSAPGIWQTQEARAGFKFALAGCCALFLALLFRLEEPSWAVTTTFVLSTPKFIGAIVEKTVFRIFGALMGAVIGYVITGSLEQSPVLFLGAMGLLVTLTTALYGGTLAPYFFRQVGYTATLVAAAGMMAPEFSWHIGLARCEEILLGIAVAAVVQMLVWPRYARVEFVTEVRATLIRLRDIFSQRPLSFGDEAEEPGLSSWLPATEKLEKLRQMIRLGTMESREFAQHAPEIERIVALLGSLAVGVAGFGRHLPENSPFRMYLEEPTRRLHRAYLEALNRLVPEDHSDLPDPQRFKRELVDAWREYRRALGAFRLQGMGNALDLHESLDHAAFFQSAKNIAHDLAELCSLLQIFQSSHHFSMPGLRLRAFTWPSREWWQAGMRAGLTLMAALFFVNYAKPPGGDLLIVGSYLFGAFTLESSDKQGDLGSFTWLMKTLGLCVVFFFGLLVLAPLMANYTVMNLVLAAFLFAAGYFQSAGRWTSNEVLLCLLLVVGLVKLNAQVPAAFQDIVGVSFGVGLASILAAFSKRLLWPVLPQKVLQNRLLGLGRFLQRTLDGPTVTGARERMSFVLGVAETASLIAFLGSSILQPEEEGKLRRLLAEMARWGLQSFDRRIRAKGPSAGLGELPAPEASLMEGSRRRIARVLEELMFSLAHPGEKPMQSPKVEQGAEQGARVIFEEQLAAERLRLRSRHLPLFTTLHGLWHLYQWRERWRAAEALTLLEREIPFAEVFGDRKL